MGDFVLQEHKSSSFHIHVDGAVFPTNLQEQFRQKYGFFDDDFDHRLVVDTGRLPAKQLTLKVEDPRSGRNVRRICDEISQSAQASEFQGLIQSEFIMTELLLQSQYTDYRHSAFPFYVHMRKVQPERGEEFKSHELHLELLADQADARLITEIARSGLAVAFGAREVTFTASGNLNEIRKIQDGIVSYLRLARGFERAKLVVEATVCHTLHRMHPANTPMVVDRVEYLQ